MASRTLGRFFFAAAFAKRVVVPPLSGLLLAFGLRRLASGVLLSQQQLAQYLQVAAQDAQAHVAFVAAFAFVAAALLAVATLQGADRRFHAGMVDRKSTRLNS